MNTPFTNSVRISAVAFVVTAYNNVIELRSKSSLYPISSVILDRSLSLLEPSYQVAVENELRIYIKHIEVWVANYKHRLVTACAVTKFLKKVFLAKLCTNYNSI